MQVEINPLQTPNRFASTRTRQPVSSLQSLSTSRYLEVQGHLEVHQQGTGYMKVYIHAYCINVTNT